MLVKDATEYLDNLAQDAGDNPELELELANAYLKIGKVQGDINVRNLGETDEATKYNCQTHFTTHNKFILGLRKIAPNAAINVYLIRSKRGKGVYMVQFHRLSNGFIDEGR